VSKSPARYDEQQLRHWQREAIRALDTEALWAWMREAAGALVPEDRRAAFVEAIRPNVTFPSEAREWARVLFTDDFRLGPEAKAFVALAPRSFFEQWLESLARAPDAAAWFEAAAPLPPGRRRGEAWRWLRAALTGMLAGPELARLVALMDKERIAKRLRAAAYLVERHAADL
jgi:glutamyl-tRNA synthetase